MEKRLLKELKMVQKKKKKLSRKKGSDSDESDSDDSMSSWVEVSVEHGGDDSFSEAIVTKNHTLDKVKTKNKNVFSNCELNTFDKIIERDVERNNLVDDISLPEGARDRKQGKSKQHPTQQSKPTPVTLVNVWGSKKDRKINLTT